MNNVSDIETKELEIIAKGAIFLRDKLADVGRDGPLVKLLSREIELVNVELAKRKNNSSPGANAARAALRRKR